jgi:asparagine synthase (glutamine-hydrolysing)
MCGIFGLFRNDGRGLDVAEVQRATSALSHRGPDDAGYLLTDLHTGRTVLCGDTATSEELNLPHLRAFAGQSFQLALGFRRLSILDPSPRGHQPMGTADGRRWVVFNGQIYNFVELRRDFEARGLRFASNTDTEVLLTACAQWDKEAFSRFVGMFALALLDLEQSSLTLARDCFGIKPLFYTYLDNGFAFASDIRALLQLAGVKRTINPSRLSDYLLHGLTNHTAETLFGGISQLPPGTTLSLALREKSRPSAEPYCRLNSESTLQISFEEACQKIREIFLRNVEIHMRSDVHIGAGLSGGIDSSAIVMAMRRLSGEKLDLHTFSYIASDPARSEERWIQIIEQQSRPLFKRVHVEAGELASGIDELIDLQGEPFGSISVFAQYKLYQTVRAHGIKVMLDGQGADELMAGYRSLLGARLASLLREKQWTKAVRFLRAASRLPGASRRQILLRAWTLLAPPFLQEVGRAILGEEQTLPAMDEKWFAAHAPAHSFYRHKSERGFLHEQLRHQIAFDDLPLLLRLEDRNAMASSVENRVPFLTPELARFVLSLPEDFLIAEDATTKAIFRHAMRDIVPPEILQRRDKIGFASPDPAWLHALIPWVERVLESDTAASLPALRAGELRREWRAIGAGKERLSVDDCRRFDARVWRWLNVIRWAEHFNVSFAV